MFQLFKNGQKKCPIFDFPKKSSQIEFVDTTPVGKFFFYEIIIFPTLCREIVKNV